MVVEAFMESNSEDFLAELFDIKWAHPLYDPPTFLFHFFIKF